jgi:hypothetical protein
MDARKLAAVVLIVIGALGLGYGGFSYTSETHRADVGPIHMSVAEKEHVNVPVWAGIALIIVGGLLLVAQRRV